ncbi:MAG: ABC transporter permease, partial [Bacteroidota bacterium]
MNKQQNPPRLFLKFFRWFCHPDIVTPIEGDLMELYDERVEKKGKRMADIRFIIDILQLLRPDIVRPLQGSLKLNNYGMFKNYIKIGIRNILKHRTFSFINIFGLALAMTVSLAIILLLADQTGYDQFHDNKNRIFRILTSRDGSGPNNASSPLPLGDYLTKNYPFVENATTLLPKVGGDAIYADGQSRENTEVRGFFADENFFEVFDFQLTAGNSKSALNSPNSIVLTKNVAYRLFNDAEAIGKTIQLTDRGLGIIKIDLGSMKEGTPKDFGSYVVTGVIDDSQYKSHIKFDVLVSSKSLDNLYQQKLLKDDSQNWYRYSNGYTYLLLQKSANISQLNSALTDVISVNYSENENFSQLELIPQALTEISPGDFTGNPISLSLPIQAYYVLIALALIIILSACLNYANLSIARITSRTKEIGVRKVNGASRKNLRTQFLTESVLTSFCALLLAILLLIALQPLLSTLWFTEIF